MVFTQDECEFIGRHYYHTESYKNVVQMFTSAFPDTAAANKSSIVRLVKKLEHHGTVVNLKKESWRCVLTTEKLREIQTKRHAVICKNNLGIQFQHLMFYYKCLLILDLHVPIW